MGKRTGMVPLSKIAGTHMKPEFPYQKHQEVLSSCQDVPESSPAFQLPLLNVGISSKTVWINLPQGLIPFEASIDVDLPGMLKGIHMSRMEQAISELFEKNFSDLNSYTDMLCRKILGGQKCQRASVLVKGTIPRLSVTPVTSKRSVDSVRVEARTEIFREKNDMTSRHSTGVEVAHITACPCTQVYNRGLFETGNSPMPFPTHSQRCLTWLILEGTRAAASMEEIYECLRACLHISQDLLKRPDEAELVLKSHRQPQFAEDVVRLVARETATRFAENLPEDTLIYVKSTSYESIHSRNVTCSLKCKMGQVAYLLEK